MGKVLGFVSFIDRLVTMTWNISGSVTGAGGACSGEVRVLDGSAEPLFSGGAIGGLALGAGGVPLLGFIFGLIEFG